MAHIPDGILSLPVLVGGGVIAAAGVALSLRQLDDRAIPRMAILAAVFFAASLISVPVGPSSVHLLLSGLMGIILGLGIFPAVLVALSLWLSSSEFTPVAKILLLTYFPLALADAAITAAVVGFLMRVKPQALFPYLPDRGE